MSLGTYFLLFISVFFLTHTLIDRIKFRRRLKRITDEFISYFSIMEEYIMFLSAVLRSVEGKLEDLEERKKARNFLYETGFKFLKESEEEFIKQDRSYLLKEEVSLVKEKIKKNHKYYYELLEKEVYKNA